MAKIDWGDGERATPYRPDRGRQAQKHEEKIQRLTLAKYKAICEANTGHPFCDSVLRQIKNQGWVSKKQAAILFGLDSSQRERDGR